LAEKNALQQQALQDEKEAERKAEEEARNAEMQQKRLDAARRNE
jgi:hypothetical protein